jgi:hypothetical protein
MGAPAAPLCSAQRAGLHTATGGTGEGVRNAPPPTPAYAGRSNRRLPGCSSPGNIFLTHRAISAGASPGTAAPYFSAW